MGIKVSATEIPAVLVVESDSFRDDRGFFMETYHRARFAENGITEEFLQDNHSRSKKGVLRGLHYQDMSAPMGKLVRCSVGSVLDVAVDLRVGSPTFAKWVGVELTSENMRQLWVPVGFAHAFVALTDGAEVQYKCTNVYTPSAEGAIRWNDPDLGIEWPVTEPIVSGKDQSAQSLKEYLEKPAFHL